jgi:phage shock protein E
MVKETLFFEIQYWRIFMKKYIVTLLLALLLAWGHNVVAKDALDLSGRTLIIDVRTAQEYNGDHFKNAVNVPLNVIGKKIKEIVPDYNETIILYCKTGMRARIAKQILEKMGYKKVINAGTLNKLEDMSKKDRACEGC